jgi:hypothetical protein
MRHYINALDGDGDGDRLRVHGVCKHTNGKLTGTTILPDHRHVPCESEDDGVTWVFTYVEAKGDPYAYGGGKHD